jgi:hypothetical protein
MSRHLILVPGAIAVLLMPAAAAGRPGDGARFAAFAKRARAQGTLAVRQSFRGDPDHCSSEGTCGVAGTVTTALRVRSGRALRVRGERVVVPVAGTASAVVRDTGTGRRCEARAGVASAALRFTADSRGLLLRPGGAPGDDPFDTACRGPLLAELGAAAIAPVRLGHVNAAVKVVRVRVRSRRIVKRHGYVATVTTDANLVLRR